VLLLKFRGDCFAKPLGFGAAKLFSPSEPSKSATNKESNFRRFSFSPSRTDATYDAEDAGWKHLRKAQERGA